MDEKWLEGRYWPNVIKSESCWIWVGRRAVQGHGLVSYHGIRYAAHTVAVCLPDGLKKAYGMIVSRSCQEKLCVNPEHLKLIERKDFNFKKSVEIRRKIHPGIYIMTEEKALEVVELKAQGFLQKDVAKMLQISPSTVSQVMTGKEWNTPKVKERLEFHREKLQELARQVRSEARMKGLIKMPLPVAVEEIEEDFMLPRSAIGD